MPDIPILLQPELASASRFMLLDSEVFHHIRRVLRLRDGDAIELRDGRGLSAEARIVKATKRGAELELGEKRELPTPPGPRLGLALPLLKGKRLDWVLEKTTELGVASFHLYIGEHSVVRRDKGHERYASIIQAAFCQSRRPLLPELRQPVSFADLAREAAENRWRQVWADEELGYGGGAEQNHPPREGEILAWIGPEGGFSASERELLVENALALSLGPNRLRSETAAIALAGRLLLPR